MSTISRFTVLLLGASLAFAALAQPAPEDRTAVDPPTRVARLSYLHGDVSFVPAGENEWVAAHLNRPIVGGDKLWTDRNSRAELELGAAAIRMDQQTSFDFLNLDDNTAQMELTQGSLNLRVRRLYDGQTYEIDTPTLAFIVNRVGEFRVDVDPDGRSTIVSVLHGGGEVYGEGGARLRVEEGQSITFRDPQLRDYRTADLPPPDAFDEFCLQRDHRWDAAPARRYVHEEVIGYEDLDEYGAWDDVPQYGHVWYPSSVAVGWAPYHFGHWAWIGAYGWTWVDDEPWGFAPFHYGRWVFVGGRWGWCPGPLLVDVRPVYAPALVAFIGGGGLSVGISVGGPIGWFPLGWGDPYFPPYHASYNYFRNVNVSNTVINNTVINNYYGGYAQGNLDYTRLNYVNRTVAGAVTAVPANAFVSARPVATAAIPVTPNTFQNARIVPVAAVAPTRASLAPPIAAKAAPPPSVLNRPIVAATQPPAPIAPFTRQEALLAKNPGRPLPISQLRASPSTTANVATADTGKIRVVTPSGSPLRESAQGLSARPTAAAPGHPLERNGQAGPATGQTRALPGPERAGGRPMVNANPSPHLDSARFAHPGNNEVGSRPNAVTPPSRVPPGEREAPRASEQLPAINASPSPHVDSARFAHPGNNEVGSRPNAVTPPSRVPPGEREAPRASEPRPAINASPSPHVDSARFAHPGGNGSEPRSIESPSRGPNGYEPPPPRDAGPAYGVERGPAPMRDSNPSYGERGPSATELQYHRPSPPAQEFRPSNNLPRNEYRPVGTMSAPSTAPAPKPEFHAPPPPQVTTPAMRAPPPPPPQRGGDKNWDEGKRRGGG
jgi:hypothetical protein